MIIYIYDCQAHNIICIIKIIDLNLSSYFVLKKRTKFDFKKNRLLVIEIWNQSLFWWFALEKIRRWEGKRERVGGKREKNKYREEIKEPYRI